MRMRGGRSGTAAHGTRRRLPVDLVSRLVQADFMPHGYCYLWFPEILWLHVLSDGLIALAYFIIPAS